MFPGNTKGGGMFAFPDVCKVPAPPAPFAPAPFPNLKIARTHCKGTVKGMALAIKAFDKLPSSKGDEAGTLKGMASPKELLAGISKQVKDNAKAADKILVKAKKAKSYKSAKKLHAQAKKQDKRHKKKLKKDVKLLVQFAKQSKDKKLLALAVKVRKGLGVS